MRNRHPGFDEFFDEHYVVVVNALTLATGSRSLGEEAAQEGFARAFRAWPRVREMGRPVGWVYTVALNVVRKTARRRAREAEFAVALPVVDTTASVATRVALRDAVLALPQRQREAVVLRYFADLSIDDTAAAMRCAPGTVKSTVAAALRALRIEFDEDEDGECNANR
jgi:RNA polymerase sigma-70 factor, ECF subfamily